ncbi:BRO family protein [Ferribacterium limneticum]|uniref:BRO family protein n=1 Tax=Ferribacterium limneticum TaxID=76259 RepID=UPI00384E372B|nr:KilA-N domain-containing protein [Ferribacterium limneticum]UCV31990.1 KilA-N domain-containing protein [Ferribacterium limneticum]
MTADVCEVLGFKEHRGGGYSHHLFRVDHSEKVSLRRSDIPNDSMGVLFGKQVAQLSLISESGLYKLVLRSRTPQALAFQDWVTKEILPSIRKTGSFVTGQPSLVENPQMSALELAAIHAPAQFFALDSTKALVAELKQSPISEIDPVQSIRGGAAPGSFVCKELVYAYAMRISASFQLKVIRFFDTLQTQGMVSTIRLRITHCI